MDLGLVAAVMARTREGDVRRYQGCAMFSALPQAPVVDDQRRRVGRRPEPLSPG